MQRNALILGMILLLLGSIVSPLSVGFEIAQQSRSDTLYVGGTGLGNYTSIQEAVNDANPGDTVFVYDDSAPYMESVVINKSIRVRGENKDTTIIYTDSNYPVFTIQSDSVTLSEFNIQQTSIGVISMSQHNTISDLIIEDENCLIGIALYNSTHNKISKNYIHVHFVGISLEISKFNVIEKNYISTTINDGIGVSIADMSIFNKIIYNYIENNQDRGIYITMSWGNRIIKNNFIGNTVQADFDLSSGNIWWRNYWDDWTSFLPRPIQGRRYSLLNKKLVNWTTFDFLPAKQPY